MSSHHTRILGVPTQPAEVEASPTWEPGSARAETEKRIRPGSHLAGYEVIQLIGAGGMGRVFEVRHAQLQKSFALKLMSEDLEQDPDAVERFRIETLALGKLDHTNIVQAIDAGHWNGRPYLVTQLLRGTDLASLVARQGPLALDQVCQFARQISGGLQAAHEVGLFHRDIKPSNLFLENNGNLKLIDFGLVRSNANESCTRAGCLMGSVDYLSPEQANDPRRADARSDIYSLGCTLIYLLSGQPPFPDQEFPGLNAKLLAHGTCQPVWLASQGNDGLLPLQQLIGQMLAKDPDLRPQSAEEVLERLTGLELAAARSSANHSTFQRLPRNPIIAAAAVAGIFLLPALGWWHLSMPEDPSTANGLSSAVPRINETSADVKATTATPPAVQPEPEIATDTSAADPTVETLQASKTHSARGANLPSKWNQNSQNPALQKTQPR